MSLVVVSVVLSFMNACLPKILKKISPCFIKKDDPSRYLEVKEEIVAELRTVSVRHDFPKYAKLMRRLNKLTDEKKASDAAYQDAYKQVLLKLSYVSQGIMTLLSLALFWMYRFQPVIRLPFEWLSPLDFVLSWPIQTAGVISFPVWFIICNSVSKLLVGSIPD